MEARILVVDLSERKTRVETVPDSVLRLFPGGKSLAAYVFYNSTPPGTPAFHPGNSIVFASGGLSGQIPGSGKANVTSKSPLTGLMSDSAFGDYFAVKLRRAGYQAILVKGASEDPVYLHVDDDGVEILDASPIWGRSTWEATDWIRRRHGDPGLSVAAIGPAGERLVRYATIIADKQRAAGRGGLGAVMGSKKLKAIAVNGSGEIPAHDPVRLEELKKDLYKKYSESPRTAESRAHGTTNALIYSGSVGMSPSYNFRKPHIPESLAKRLSHEAFKQYEVDDPPHWIHGKSCPVKCARYARLSYRGTEFEVKPEYENLGMLGAAPGVFEVEPVLYFNYLANLYGVDTISAGNTIAWFLELVEEGLVDPREWGLKARGFGDAPAVEELLKLIAERRGVGSVLAEGVKRASMILGKGEDKAVHVKGLEAPAWDPRGLRGFALSYATADVGASHLRGWPRTRDKPSDGPAKDVVESMALDRDRKTLFDTMGICVFIPYKLEEIAEVYKAATGFEAGPEELLESSRRQEALARIWSVLDWMTPPLDDVIPQRWWEPEPSGPAAGSKAFIDVEDFLEARRHYYMLRGWHPEYGVPLPETVEKLGMPWARGDAERALETVERRMGL